MTRLLKICSVIFFALATCSFAFTAPHRLPDQHRLAISFSHFVGTSPLVLDSEKYLNGLGQDFTVTKFKYYISNIILRTNDGKAILCPGYYLVDESVDMSKRLTLENIPVSSYSSLEFMIGVDSLHNCSGAQSGALDPVNAMFWAWNTGYIFLKFEGSSSYSKTPGRLLEYHVGGYRQPFNCVRRVSLSLGKKDQEQVRVKVQLLEIFENPVSVDFSKLSSVVDFHNATIMADNYCDMFTILRDDEKH